MKGLKFIRNKWFLRAVTIAVIAFVLFGMGRIVARDWDEIVAYPWHINGWLLAGSIALGVVSIGLSSKVMHWIIQAFGGKIGFWKMGYIFWLSNLGRYAPGKVIQLVGMFVLLKREGISRTITLSAMAVFQGMFVLAGGIVAILLMGPDFISGVLPGVPRWTIYAAAGLGLIASYPRILQMILNLGLKILRRDGIEYDLSTKKWLLLTVSLLVMWFLFACSFGMLVRSVSPIATRNFLYAGGTFLAAYIVGWIVLIAPGGLGVREGVIMLFLSAIMPKGVAGIVSIVSRPWMLLIELLLLFIIWFVYSLVLHGKPLLKGFKELQKREK